MLKEPKKAAIHCPECHLKLFVVQNGSTGLIEAKCKRCKKVWTINLESMKCDRQMNDG